MKESDAFMQQLVDDLSFDSYAVAEESLYPTPPLDSNLSQLFDDTHFDYHVPRYCLDEHHHPDAPAIDTLGSLIDGHVTEHPSADEAPESNYNWKQEPRGAETPVAKHESDLYEGQLRTPCRGLDYYRVRNNVTIRAFEGVAQHGSQYVYHENRKYGTSLYEPAVNRKLRTEEAAGETAQTSRKKSVNMGNFALCPFCPMNEENTKNEFQKLFFKRNDSNYLHHMIQFHGVFSNGKLVKDPVKRGWFFPKDSLEPVEVVECPYCLECVSLKKFKAANPDEHRLLKYLRHVKEYHKTGKNLQQVSFSSERQ
ncbi:hypothetical protein OGAPHI_006484 [Ogataea philodendri]|uniref:Transcription regulator Rua1 C-terminal domain-containing protein n=1 Tax=Ogataea philodendri TaxID=1378263 RepID=A0A9P8NYZ7_9ASCO|nr:uncharacterized protein OGAPHI_006484 [Ogataea philodendri]KAH3661634.1 hypothetical protein OGAPHI_006484 [Ogataea philodendri]